MKVFSAFTGIGGFELGILDAFPKAEIVGYSEICRDAERIYLKHFPDHAGKNFGDIDRLVFDSIGKSRKKEVNEARVNALPDFDLLVGGSPCQDLSISKKNRQGLDGEKSSLFYAYVNILAIKKPRWFCLENVGSMSNADRDKITSILKVEPIELNASLFSAQNRSRYIWTNWPVNRPEDLGIVLERNGVPVHAWSKSFRPGKGVDGKNSMDERIRINGKSNAVTCSMGAMESCDFIPDTKMDFPPRKVYDRADLFFYQIQEKWLLTFEEKEFLQTFPKGWTAKETNNVRQRVLGNAVPPKMIGHVMKCLKDHITESKEKDKSFKL